jgi:alanyl-tRNA synthetase
MLGNWSFGDYFKTEAIEWAWELVTEVWKFPKERVYATVYKPGPGDPSEFDQEAYDQWAKIFKAAGLDPAIHIVNGNKKDNFWMMGETGPCGPCSELHIDLTPDGDTKGSLVNTGDPRCIEIWNLVFIQFNANSDGTFVPLPAKHVDTGMGFERVTSMIQGTKHFTDFKNAKISNYETDIFRPLFDEIEKLSGLKYGSTLPKPGSTGDTEQERNDVAFRVIADHIRTLSFSIADGINPGNEGRNYVLRRILRRAVKYGRSLGFEEPFFYKLVAVLAQTMGDVFPEVRSRQTQIEVVIRREEVAFGKTLKNGLALFETEAAKLSAASTLSGSVAFRLYDEQGFPLDLTELLARERGLKVDVAGFEQLMEEQRIRAQAAQKKTVIELSQLETKTPTKFVGYDANSTSATVLEVVELKNKTAVILDASVCYAEMGGQVGDTGELSLGAKTWRVIDTQKSGPTWLHFIEEGATPEVGQTVQLSVDALYRARIEAHHSATHLLHWALRKVVGDSVGQKGSYVGPDRFRFDFTHHEGLTPEQVAEVERLVNEKLEANDPVKWTERPYAEVKGDASILQFFGDKYGEFVRVVDIGGYSKELCGGTHVKRTGDIGYFKLLSESAIAAGVRRVEAVTGAAVIDYVVVELTKQEERHSVLKKRQPEVVALLGFQKSGSARDSWKQFSARQDQIEKIDAEVREWEKAEAKKAEAGLQREGAAQADILIPLASEQNGVPLILATLGDLPSAILPHVADHLKTRWKGVAVLATTSGGRVALLASVSADFTKKVQAGKIIQAIAPIVGGKGGGRPELAQGGGTDISKISEALEKAKTLIA